MPKDDEALAMRAAGAAKGPEVPPLCPRCRSQLLLWTSDSRSCPLCTEGARSGSWLLCQDCASEAGVCVIDAAPLDGSSATAVPWLAELVRAASLDERAEA